jgi:hypothetical protein
LKGLTPGTLTKLIKVNEFMDALDVAPEIAGTKSDKSK